MTDKHLFLILGDGSRTSIILNMKEEHLENFLYKLIRAKVLVTSLNGIFYNGENFETIENSKIEDRSYINMNTVSVWEVR
jgi:hypothetical protein